MQSFNNNYGYGYQQPNYQTPSYQAPQYQQPQQQLNLYAFVDGIEGAKAYQVRPNTSMLLMDSQRPICYRKQVDALGRTVSFEMYELVPYQEKQPQQVEYVSLEQFNKEIAEIKALITKEE